MSAKLSTDEARLIAVLRAVHRFGDTFGVVRPQDTSLIADYLNVVTDPEQLDSKSEDYIDAFLDGLIAGFAAARLASAGIDPEELAAPEADSQTGVDPITGNVRT